MKVCGKKKKRGKKIFFVALVVISIIGISVGFFLKKNVNPMIVTISNEKVRVMVSDAVSRSVLDVMGDYGETDYLTVVRDDKDKISSVSLNSQLLSELAQKITIESQKKINESGQDGIKIPIGSLTGVTLFTGLGPDIKIRIYLVGSTQTRIISVFSESGINQTLHSIFLEISGSVAVAVPGLPSNIETSTRVLMSEVIIVGEVPATYLKATQIGDMMDLVAN